VSGPGSHHRERQDGHAERWRLSDRLRELRTTSFGQRQKQAALGKVFGGVGGPTVSGWENGNENRRPPVDRLRDYARFFCSIRSLSPSLRLLPDDELTGEEAERRLALESELLGLLRAAELEAVAEREDIALPAGDASSDAPRVSQGQVAPGTTERRRGLLAVTVIVTVVAGSTWYLSRRLDPRSVASCQQRPATNRPVPSQLNHPSEVIVSGSDTLFVLDTENHRLLLQKEEGGPASTIAGTAVAGCWGDGGRAVNAQLNGPDGLAVGTDGTIFIADTENARVRAVDRTGTIRTVAGGGKGGSIGDGGPAREATLSTSVEGLALGPDGTLYIADADQHRVRAVDTRGVIRTVIGRGAPVFSGDGRPATMADTNTPQAVVVAPDGTLFLADSGNNRVRMVDGRGIITTIAGDGSGNGCQSSASGDDAQLACPQGLALAPDGALYISDSLNHRVRRRDPTGAIVTVAGTGKAGYSGDGGPAGAAQLSLPQGLSVAPDGSLYIVDRGNHVVRRVTPDGTITTVLQ
jgi:sugar lactone lactonase YvrE